MKIEIGKVYQSAIGHGYNHDVIRATSEVRPGMNGDVFDGVVLETNSDRYKVGDEASGFMVHRFFERVNVTQNQTQIGGTHYQTPIQPWDYILANSLGFLEGNIIKYVTRYQAKNGVEDLKKARHYLDKLIEVTESVKK